MRLIPQTNTLRFKISVLYVALIGLLLLAFQVVLFFNYAHAVAKEFDQNLQIKAEQIGGAVNTFREMLGTQQEAMTLAAQQTLNLNIQYPQYTFMSESPEKFWLADAKKLGLDQDYLAIMDTQGNLVAGSAGMPAKVLAYFDKIGRSYDGARHFFSLNLKSGPLRVITMPYSYAYRQSYQIMAATPYGPVQRGIREHFLFTLGSTLLFLIMASLLVRLFVIRVLSSVMDISNTARNITQDNLHARIQLKHADAEIQHLTGSLNNMIGRLEKSFAHIKEFSLEMAHEVKTPLAIISGESQLALGSEHSKEEYREMFKTVLKEVKRTQAFVSDLLLLTKLDYRLIQLRFEPIDLTAFVHEIYNKMLFMAAAKGVAMQEAIPPEPLFIRGDKIHLRRVFFNLIDNALKFTPAGGQIRVSVHRRDQSVVVMVSDSGCGIPREEMSKIFSKFYHGLGLSIVNSIIAFHGGKVSADSEPGEGAAFKMEFALADIGKEIPSLT